MPHRRLASLDALRGFDMFWIMSGEQIVHALARVTGWSVFVWMSDQLHHTVWNGFTFYDMIFPLFLFMAGVSMPFSFGGKDARTLYPSMIRRMLILVLLGVVVNGGLRLEGFHETRFASVLGRIGIAWFLAGLLYLNTSPRGLMAWLAGLLLGYWALMEWIPVPGYGAGVLTMQGSLESYIDRLLLPGRLHDGVHDPEGVLSTLPAVGTALLGVFAGRFLKGEQSSLTRVPFTPLHKSLLLAAAGLGLLGLGLAWDPWFPINKRLWTSSFVLYAGGWSVLLLALFYLVVDVLGWKRWAAPFIWVGTNSILIYLASEGLVNFGYTAQALTGGLVRLSPALWQPVWTAASVTMVQLALLYFFYHKKWFLKI